MADASVGCRVWNPHPQPNETIRWSGACANGYAQGRGAAQWFRNALPFESDEGEWREGRQTGFGTQVWPTGRYEGEIADGEPHGQGVLTFRAPASTALSATAGRNGAGALANGSDVYGGTWTDGCFRDYETSRVRRCAVIVPLTFVCISHRHTSKDIKAYSLFFASIAAVVLACGFCVEPGACAIARPQRQGLPHGATMPLGEFQICTWVQVCR